MAKKKLILNESTTRRFMKLATIKPTYVSNFLTEADEDEEMMNPALDAGAPEDAPADPMPEADPSMETEDEMDMDMGGEEDGAEGMIEDFIKNAIMPWAKENGVSMEVEGDEAEEAAEPEMDMAPEADMDAGLEGGDAELPDDEMPEDAEANYGMNEEIDADLDAANVDVIDEDEIVAEVTRRVARRLLRESAKRK